MGLLMVWKVIIDNTLKYGIHRKYIYSVLKSLRYTSLNIRHILFAYLGIEYVLETQSEKITNSKKDENIHQPHNPKPFPSNVSTY